jgi:hypothetical protein
MAGSLHGSARTTPRVRAELQASQEKSGTLARRYGLSRTTVNKWRARTTTDDAPMGPIAPHSTVLTAAEEAMIVEFRRRTLLPLDDVLGCLRDSVPSLTRSSCIVAWNATASPGYLRTRISPLNEASLLRCRSATYTSTSASCVWRTPSLTCSSL